MHFSRSANGSQMKYALLSFPESHRAELTLHATPGWALSSPREVVEPRSGLSA